MLSRPAFRNSFLNAGRFFWNRWLFDNQISGRAFVVIPHSRPRFTGGGRRELAAN
jgi:hypothetical protein